MGVTKNEDIRIFAPNLRVDEKSSLAQQENLDLSRIYSVLFSFMVSKEEELSVVTSLFISLERDSRSQRGNSHIKRFYEQAIIN